MEPLPLTLWFQCDKYGWDALWGSRFTMEMQLGEPLDPGAGSFSNRARYWHLLTSEERGVFHAKGNEIIARLPGSLQDAAVSVKDDSGEEIVVLGYKPTSSPPPSGADFWMNYFTESDVEAWAHLLQGVLVPLMARFEAARGEA